MAGTRSSARQAAKASSSPTSSQSKPSPSVGSKRKASQTSPSKSKKGKKSNEKEQTTIEDSLPVEDKSGRSNDVEMKDEVQSAEPAEEDGEKPTEASKEENGETAMDDKEEYVMVEKEDTKEEKNGPSTEKAKPEAKTETNEEAESQDKKPKENGFDKLMGQANDTSDPKDTPENTGSKVSAAENAVEDSDKRTEETPSSILEKGLIYFFFRPRVNVDDPSSVSDIARSYIVLRPLPHGAKLTDGPIGDAATNRLLALPKKVLPASHKDRFLTFVEKAPTSMDDIKSTLTSSDYATKTAGARHTPSAAPIGEGIYAITQTGRDTHLAYILTLPSELSEVQKSVGLRQRGSYITSAKNPQASTPANAGLPQGAEYPREILEEFRGRGWMPLQPRLLDYVNTQFLLIGHGGDGLGKATQPQAEGEEGMIEEMERLEGEDGRRVGGLGGDEAVFVDLGLSAKEFEGVMTTW